MTAYRKFVGHRLGLGNWAATLLMVLGLGGNAALAATPDKPTEPASAGAAAPAASVPPAPRPAWIAFPRLGGRLQAADLGLVINTADPLSVQIGAYYIAARKLTPEQVLRVELPIKPTLSRDEFEPLRQRISAGFGRQIQALALAWSQPYAVECNAITGALALGFDAELCKRSCDASRPSRYFNSASLRPYAELGLRPSMLLAARNLEQAKALIDRGVAADGALALRGRPPVSAMMLMTDDPARIVRRFLYPPGGAIAGLGVDVKLAPAADLASARRVLMVSTGSARVALDPPPDWVPGGFGDHLTSYGGDLYGNHGQSTVLAWLDAGATASHGSVSEPCNHLQKFPHPQVLLGHYLQGATVLEAYWKSVAWPQQSLFVGEPLAAPFARVPRASFAPELPAAASGASAVSAGPMR